MDHRNFPSGWVVWLLVVAAALPVVVLLRLGWLVFSGSWDGFITQSPSEGMTLLGERWTNFWWASPAVPTLLIVGLLPLLLLAVFVATDRPPALVPTTAARHAATAVALITTLLGLVGSAGFLAQFTGLLPVEAWPSYGSSVQDAFAPFAAVTFAYVALSVTATAVLWPQQAQEQAEEQSKESATLASVAENPGGTGDAAHDAAGEQSAEEAAATPRAVSETTQAATARPGRPGPGVPAGLAHSLCQ
ncbi:hypothetical protein [Kineococcus terrestris]|uniref:hypothetical protein n=1 Tax=Kineococcus terrestris TaxID=2044856 RepID=UPI0034DACE73